MDEKLNEKLLKFEEKLIDTFVERNSSRLTKSPREILLSYVKWRHNRYTVIEDDGVFAVCDLYHPGDPIAMVLSNKDPDAFNHAWMIAEDLNDLPDTFLSVGGKMCDIGDVEVELNADFDQDFFTIEDLIGKAVEDARKKRTNEE